MGNKKPLGFVMLHEKNQTALTISGAKCILINQGFE
jgi:hypothetical protein